MNNLKQILEEIEILRKKQGYATTLMYCLNHRVHYQEEDNPTGDNNIRKKSVDDECEFRYDAHKNCKVLESDGCEYSDFAGIKIIFEYLIKEEKENDAKKT